MSVVYETRNLMDGTYPSMGEPSDNGEFLEPGDELVAMAAAAGYSGAGLTTAALLSDNESKKDESPTPTTPGGSTGGGGGGGRIKPIPKPERNVVKNARGYWECTWPNCNEDTKEFSRKCEFKYVYP
jgi:hypothetical protein